MGLMAIGLVFPLVAPGPVGQKSKDLPEPRARGCPRLAQCVSAKVPSVRKSRTLHRGGVVLRARAARRIVPLIFALSPPNRAWQRDLDESYITACRTIGVYAVKREAPLRIAATVNIRHTPCRYPLLGKRR